MVVANNGACHHRPLIYPFITGKQSSLGDDGGLELVQCQVVPGVEPEGGREQCRRLHLVPCGCQWRCPHRDLYPESTHVHVTEWGNSELLQTNK